MQKIRDFFSAVRFVMNENYHSKRFREILMGYDRVVGEYHVNPYRKHIELFDLVRGLDVDKAIQDKIILYSGMILRMDVDDCEWVFYPRKNPLHEPDNIAASEMLVQVTDYDKKWRIDICNGTDYDDWGKVQVEVSKDAYPGIGEVYQKAVERHKKGLSEIPYNPSEVVANEK